MARLVLSQPGEDVSIGGNIEVFGTSSGGEVITVLTGNVRLDASFNLGGDTVVLPGSAADYTGYRQGSAALIVRNDTLVTLQIPVGTAGTTIQFDGATRELCCSTSDFVSKQVLAYAGSAASGAWTVKIASSELSQDGSS